MPRTVLIRLLIVASVLWRVTAPMPVFAADSDVPTVIEQALIEHACRATDTAGAADEVRQECFRAQLDALRADFGPDLSRLSASDRKRIDAACNRPGVVQEREAYVECLGGQLVAVHNRQVRGRSTVPADAVPAPAVPDTAAVLPQPARRASSVSPAWLAGGITASLLVAGGFVFMARRSRPKRVCKACGAGVRDSDLCAACRHDAAESLRRVAAERVDAARALEAEARRKHEHEVERERARHETETRLREDELARCEQEAARQARPAADAPSQRAAAAVEPAEVVEEAFDPYAVLDVPRDTTGDGIRAAYERAKVKYDPSQVPPMAYAAREHLLAKTESVEQAYQMLSGGS